MEMAEEIAASKGVSTGRGKANHYCSGVRRLIRSRRCVWVSDMNGKKNLICCFECFGIKSIGFGEHISDVWI